MRKFFDSTERGPLDLLQFGIAFAGIIIALAGVVMTSSGVAVFGLLVLGFALVYFLIRN